MLEQYLVLVGSTLKEEIKMIRKLSTIVALLTVAGLLAACGGAPAGADQVEIFSWWVGGGEAAGDWRPCRRCLKPNTRASSS